MPPPHGYKECYLLVITNGGCETFYFSLASKSSFYLLLGLGLAFRPKQTRANDGRNQLLLWQSKLLQSFAAISSSEDKVARLNCKVECLQLDRLYHTRLKALGKAECTSKFIPEQQFLANAQAACSLGTLCERRPPGSHCRQQFCIPYTTVLCAAAFLNELNDNYHNFEHHLLFRFHLKAETIVSDTSF
jgi:hypothetical protein